MFLHHKTIFILTIFLCFHSPALCNEQLDYEECGAVKCVKKHGTCQMTTESSYCSCYERYTTYPKDSEIQCNYERKKQLNAFLLEFFLTYGAGHFYTDNYKLAVPKLVVFIFLYCLFIVLRIFTKSKEENKSANLAICISAAVAFAGMLAWQIFDLFWFGYNKYKDGNGVDLYPM